LIKEAQTFYEKTDIDMLHTSRYQWSNWQKRNKLKRPLDSVFFPVSANGLIEDARNFVNSADWYRRMGIPYRRGYLFSGPPGTGKSSAAEAMAGALDLPLYILNLASLSDTSLENAIGDLDHMGTAILLIEDIDTVTVDRDNKDKNQKISLGTLLNVLDGVLAADNLILIMTSNNPNNLDPALIRRGRVDKVVEFGMASEDQINGAVKRFIPQTTLEQCREIATWPRPISMAEVQEHLKTMVMKQLDKLPTE
jgi:chaperone BCS1